MKVNTGHTRCRISVHFINLPVTWLLKTNAGCFLENHTFPRNSLIVAITFKVWLIRVLKIINEAPKVM